MARTAITGVVNVVYYALMTKKEFSETGLKDQKPFVEKFKKYKNTAMYQKALRLHAELGADHRVKMKAIRILREQ